MVDGPNTRCTIREKKVSELVPTRRDITDSVNRQRMYK